MVKDEDDDETRWAQVPWGDVDAQSSHFPSTFPATTLPEAPSSDPAPSSAAQAKHLESAAAPAAPPSIPEVDNRTTRISNHHAVQPLLLSPLSQRPPSPPLLHRVCSPQLRCTPVASADADGYPETLPRPKVDSLPFGDSHGLVSWPSGMSPLAGSVLSSLLVGGSTVKDQPPPINSGSHDDIENSSINFSNPTLAEQIREKEAEERFEVNLGQRLANLASARGLDPAEVLGDALIPRAGKNQGVNNTTLPMASAAGILSSPVQPSVLYSPRPVSKKWAGLADGTTGEIGEAGADPLGVARGDWGPAQSARFETSQAVDFETISPESSSRSFDGSSPRSLMSMSDGISSDDSSGSSNSAVSFFGGGFSTGSSSRSSSADVSRVQSPCNFLTSPAQLSCGGEGGASGISIEVDLWSGRWQEISSAKDHDLSLGCGNESNSSPGN